MLLVSRERSAFVYDALLGALRIPGDVERNEDVVESMEQE